MTRRCGLIVALLVAWSASSGLSDAVEWGVGDVFLAVGDGTYHVYDHSGRFKQAITDELGGYTTDCGFSPRLDRLYTTNYTHTKVVVYDDAAEHAILQTIDPADASPGGHSGAVVFDAEGNLYVGHPDGNNLIHRYSDTGMLLATFEVEVGKRGTNWLDLSSDQRTLFYSSEGRDIYRFDTESNARMSSFAELPGEGSAFGIRLLPPGDGSGGLLVADGEDIKRLDAEGKVVQAYDDQGQDSWFAINLDPNGTSFWATDGESDQVYRYDIASGRIEQTFTAGPGETVFGVCLKGELTAAVSHAQTALPTAYSVGQNHPNPFNPSTAITYRMPASGPVRLEVYNLLGQKIDTLVNAQQKSGTYTVRWKGTDAHGRDVGSGVYIYRFVSEGLVTTRRMLLLK